MPRSTGLLLLSSSLIKAPDSDSEAASSFDLMQLFLSYYSGPFLVYPMFLRSFAEEARLSSSVDEQLAFATWWHENKMWFDQQAAYQQMAEE